MIEGFDYWNAEMEAIAHGLLEAEGEEFAVERFDFKVDTSALISFKVDYEPVESMVASQPNFGYNSHRCMAAT
jgi:hypothetical protein